MNSIDIIPSTVPTIDPKETILNSAIVSKADIKAVKPDIGDRKINPTTPTNIPFPPLN